MPSGRSTRHALVVAALVPGPELTGPARQLASSAVALRDHDIDLRVVILRRPGASPGRLVAHLRDLGVPFTEVTDRGPFDLRLPGEVRKTLDGMRADVVQTHGYKATAVARVLRLSGPRRPWIGFFHGSTAESTRAGFYHALDLRLLRSADRTVIVSASQRPLFPKTASVTLVSNAVTRPAPGEMESASLSGIHALARPRIGVIGRLSPEKGVDILLDALARMDEATAPTTLIVGDGPERDALVRRASERRVADRVVFTGHVASAWPVYPLLDLLVIPSRSEGLPNVLLEALSADVPVVATSVGAIPDVIADPRAGTLVEPGDVDALATAVMDALRCPGDDASRTARAETVDRFSMERRAAALAGIYRELTDQTGSGFVPGAAPGIAR